MTSTQHPFLAATAVDSSNQSHPQPQPQPRPDMTTNPMLMPIESGFAHTAASSSSSASTSTGAGPGPGPGAGQLTAALWNAQSQLQSQIQMQTSTPTMRTGIESEFMSQPQPQPPPQLQPQPHSFRSSLSTSIAQSRSRSHSHTPPVNLTASMLGVGVGVGEDTSHIHHMSTSMHSMTPIIATASTSASASSSSFVSGSFRSSPTLDSLARQLHAFEMTQHSLAAATATSTATGPLNRASSPNSLAVNLSSIADSSQSHQVLSSQFLQLYQQSLSKLTSLRCSERQLSSRAGELLKSLQSEEAVALSLSQCLKRIRSSHKALLSHIVAPRWEVRHHYHMDLSGAQFRSSSGSCHGRRRDAAGSFAIVCTEQDCDSHQEEIDAGDAESKESAKRQRRGDKDDIQEVERLAQ